MKYFFIFRNFLFLSFLILKKPYCYIPDFTIFFIFLSFTFYLFFFWNL